MRQTTESVNWRSVVDTAVWDFLNWDARFTRDSNPGLQHDLHAPQARALPLAVWYSLPDNKKKKEKEEKIIKIKNIRYYNVYIHKLKLSINYSN